MTITTHEPTMTGGPESWGFNQARCYKNPSMVGGGTGSGGDDWRIHQELSQLSVTIQLSQELQSLSGTI